MFGNRDLFELKDLFEAWYAEKYGFESDYLYKKTKKVCDNVVTPLFLETEDLLDQFVKDNPDITNDEKSDLGLAYWNLMEYGDFSH